MDEGKLTHVIQRKNRWGPNLNICALVMDGKFRVFTGDDATPQSVACAGSRKRMGYY